MCVREREREGASFSIGVTLEPIVGMVREMSNFPCNWDHAQGTD